MMELIVAVDREWGIGYKGDLLARVRGDLRHFRELTAGKTVICGSNTLLTFPGAKPLKNRKNIILHPDPSFAVEGAQIVHSIPELLSYTEEHKEEKFIVIGGASVYRQLLPYCSFAYVTKFDRSFDKDVYFDNLDEDPDWSLLRTEAPLYSGAGDTVDGMPYRYTVYIRARKL